MPIRKISTSKATYQSTIEAPLNDTLVINVKGISGEPINQNIDKQNNHNGNYKKNVKVDNALNNALKRAKFYIASCKESLPERIKLFVKAYNQLIFLIVKKEQKIERQYDQYIQHYIMSHHVDFLRIGIGVENAIYLEYNMIKIRQAVNDLGQTAIIDAYFADDSIFANLIKSAEITIEKLCQHTDKIGNIGMRFDSKA